MKQLFLIFSECRSELFATKKLLKLNIVALKKVSIDILLIICNRTFYEGTGIYKRPL